MCIASWDNLSSKQHLRVVPDRLVVWNEMQKSEAVSLHDVPPERVFVTGAQSFDIWFDWQSRPREEFCRLVGLDPDRAYLLYVGGSLFRAALTEAEYVRDVWLPEVRADSVLAELSLLIRPHPYRAKQWSEVDWNEFGNVVLWPRDASEMPIEKDSRADFFDSIYHSAGVVGINTSAMIEAAVVGRSVHTLLAPEFADSQTGTFHFDYLLKVGGGLLRVSDSHEAHRQSLRTTVEGSDELADARRRTFLREFVRPLGLDRPAGPAVIASIESLADLGRVAPGGTAARLLPARMLLYLLYGLTRSLGPAVAPFSTAKRRGRLRKRTRKLLRALRRRMRRR